MKDDILQGWFSEVCPLWPGRALSIELEEELYNARSEFQQIEVYKTKNCGVMLVLDGIIQCTEDDEFAYQEMLSHVPLFSHPLPERVLVIGGGDGGVLREIGRHACVKEIDICEIDSEVIAVSKRFLPSMAIGFDDPRVNVHIADGNEFVSDKQGYYDVIIVDSSDPVGPGEALFEEPFYARMKKALRPDGVIATQSESFYLHKDVVKHLFEIVRSLFPVYGYSYMLVPTYPGGNIGICVGSLTRKVKVPCRKPDDRMQCDLQYYTPEIHQASFVLPAFGHRMLDS